MKKKGILNRDLAAIFASLGHTDQVVIADCGLPVPDHVLCVDLSLEQGTPAFKDVVRIVLEDLEVEKMILAKEMKEFNSNLYRHMATLEIDHEFVTHLTFKKLTADAKVIIRTGENTPFSNVILQSGVTF
ncbi:D-ribose pyranase [Salisediminibacterium beveridgei]|uniref:D-ribose pyranase n=1 Tax=Salisediminibacterium beveridgei TaxID=632773 RepID=A0A1D7QRZ9_9BACI|nr:D-ribose pyranase [Salisediminibacterium beveridgei]AOM81785.1 Ribose ABC transport system, high affinity permease RbsD [Salisediminibacterium beveridgei]